MKTTEAFPAYTLNIRQVAVRRGITSSYQLQKALDLKSPSHAVRLYADTGTSISLQTLSLLCEKLDCTPNDLLILKSTR